MKPINIWGEIRARSPSIPQFLDCRNSGIDDSVPKFPLNSCIQPRLWTLSGTSSAKSSRYKIPPCRQCPPLSWFRSSVRRIGLKAQTCGYGFTKSNAKTWAIRLKSRVLPETRIAPFSRHEYARRMSKIKLWRTAWSSKPSCSISHASVAPSAFHAAPDVTLEQDLARRELFVRAFEPRARR